MIFRSELVAAQWDTWCYFHRDTYYLYYALAAGAQGVGVITGTVAR